ncbi:hypothetical protein DCS_04552 [Drechmeria coniospora]|uniref:Uncharacterized protein n=1 Tax=Drechmeria coniospora TaxID=98403 RepID=A0A151GKI1_DRECN|nr:hypothetical protein DCS_04552 [Drechmeria coniospora]KYK57541.1 hypothetical protein DCS_04552 [Drechmeria coniospora]
MSLQASPRQEIRRLLRRRNVAVVPKNQQSLLEQPSSWAVDFKGKLDSRAHIPGDVLETVKAAYQNASQVRDDQPSIPSGAPDAFDSVRDEQVVGATKDGGLASSSPETLTSWESSSSESLRNARRQWVRLEKDASPSPAQTQLESASLVREMPPAMAPPPLPPPRLEQAPVYEDGLDSDEDSETDLSQRREQVGVSTARSPPTATPSQPQQTFEAGETPPCAQMSQPIIPDTAEAEYPPPRSRPDPEGRRRRHKMITYDSSPIKKGATETRKMPTTKAFASVTDMSSSHTNSSSSIVPATSSNSSALSSVVPSIEPVADSGPRALSSQSGEDAEKAPERVASPRPAAGLPPATDPSPVSDPGPCSQKLNPYEAFAAVYPNYRTDHAGSLWNFVRGCVCVEILQKDMALRECLYDDFIRAFSSGYLKYVAAAGPGREAVSAIEWFSMLPGAPLYNRMVVTRGCIDHVLLCFPREVARARSILNRDASDNNADQKKPPSERQNGERVPTTPTKTPPCPERARLKDRKEQAGQALHSQQRERTMVPSIPPASEKRIDGDRRTEVGALPFQQRERAREPAFAQRSLLAPEVGAGSEHGSADGMDVDLRSKSHGAPSRAASFSGPSRSTFTYDSNDTSLPPRIRSPAAFSTSSQVSRSSRPSFWPSRTSRLLDQLATNTTTGAKKRPAEEQSRLREHFKNRRLRKSSGGK